MNLNRSFWSVFERRACVVLVYPSSVGPGDMGNSGSILLATGNAGGGNSGDVSLTTGVSEDGDTGSINISVQRSNFGNGGSIAMRAG